MWTPLTALIVLAPLYLLGLGCLVVFWDLRRRHEGPPVPSDQQVERFSLEKLEKIGAEVEGLHARQSGVTATVEDHLEKAVEERRSAAGMRSRAIRVLNDKREEEIGPTPTNGGEFDEAAALAAVEARLGAPPRIG